MKWFFHEIMIRILQQCLEKKKLKTKIPFEMIKKRHCQCQNIIKIFVTSKSTSFDLLKLSKLGESNKRNNNTTDWID